MISEIDGADDDGYSNDVIDELTDYFSQSNYVIAQTTR